MNEKDLKLLNIINTKEYMSVGEVRKIYFKDSKKEVRYAMKRNSIVGSWLIKLYYNGYLGMVNTNDNYYLTFKGEKILKENNHE